MRHRSKRHTEFAQNKKRISFFRLSLLFGVHINNNEERRKSRAPRTERVILWSSLSLQYKRQNNTELPTTMKTIRQFLPTRPTASRTMTEKKAAGNTKSTMVFYCWIAVIVTMATTSVPEVQSFQWMSKFKMPTYNENAELIKEKFGDRSKFFDWIGLDFDSLILISIVILFYLLRLNSTFFFLTSRIHYISCFLTLPFFVCLF